MAENPSQPEGDASPQDLDLEAQLDQLLEKLEEVDPQAVPADLRKNPPAEPAEAVSDTPEPEPAKTEPEPIAEAINQAAAEPVDVPAVADVSDAAEPAAVVQGEAKAAEPAEPGLDADTISAMAADLLSAQIDSTIEAASVEAAAEPVAEPVAGPVDAEQEPQPIQPLSEDELSSQLDALLTQVQNPGAAEAETPADAPIRDAVESPVEETSDAVAAAPAGEVQPEPMEALSEDDLADQIQNLLNEVQNPGAAAEAPGADTSADQASDAAAEEVPSAEPTQVAAETDASEAADAGAVSIDQIDAMLAESAAQAIEHGPAPETDIPPGTDEVLAVQAKAEQEAEARAQADRDAAEPVPVAADAAEPEAEPEPVPVPAPVDAAEPEPAAVEPVPVAAGGASAADVANELDNDAQPVGRSDDDLTEAAFAAEPFQGEEDGAGFEAEPVVMNQGGLKKAERALLMICSKVNKPLHRLSPEMRDSIGWVAVGTTGFGLFMVLYGVLF